jgi:hypothetical protein
MSEIMKQWLDHTEQLVRRVHSIHFPEKITKNVLLGFDGYIDNLLSIIKIRRSQTDYDIMTSMNDWAKRISDAAGSSASIERILKKQAVGGFTCNVGKALSTLCGCSGNIHLIGAYGYPNQIPIFSELLIKQKNCNLHSIGDPGITDAYEFSNGKIMMVNFGSIHAIDWKYILNHITRDELIELYKNSSLYGVGYWASTPHGSDIYQGLQQDVLPNLPSSIKHQFLLLDLSDLKKRVSEDFAQLKNLFSGFENYIKIALLLNDKELTTLHAYVKKNQQDVKWNDMNKITMDERISFFLKMTSEIQEYYNLTAVICHTPNFATIAWNKNVQCILNTFQSNPKFTTSAGDHFTAGVAYGILLDLPLEMLPLLGNINTSKFVMTGLSPDNKIFHNPYKIDLKSF